MPLSETLADRIPNLPPLCDCVPLLLNICDSKAKELYSNIMKLRMCLGGEGGKYQIWRWDRRAHLNRPIVFILANARLQIEVSMCAHVIFAVLTNANGIKYCLSLVFGRTLCVSSPQGVMAKFVKRSDSFAISYWFGKYSV